MPIGLKEKQAIVAEVNETASQALSAVMADYRGVSVDDMTALRKQAREAGVRIEQIAPDGDRRQPALSLLVDPDADLQVMRQEIFGPLLPILPYDDLEETIGFINERDRPLGLYYFGQDRGEMSALLDRTVAGGVTVNDVLFHISVDDLPFGGVGPSGMGAYHGIEGFKTFSHAKSVYKQAFVNVAGLLGGIPPYGARLKSTLKREIRK